MCRERYMLKNIYIKKKNKNRKQNYKLLFPQPSSQNPTHTTQIFYKKILFLYPNKFENFSRALSFFFFVILNWIKNYFLIFILIFSIFFRFCFLGSDPSSNSCNKIYVTLWKLIEIGFSYLYFYFQLFSFS